MGAWPIHLYGLRLLLLWQPQQLIVDGLLLLLNVVLLDPGACKQVFLALVLLLPLLILLKHHFTGPRQLLDVLPALDGCPFVFLGRVLRHLISQIRIQLILLQLLLLHCEFSSEIVLLGPEVCPRQLLELLGLLILASLLLLHLDLQEEVGVLAISPLLLLLVLDVQNIVNVRLLLVVAVLVSLLLLDDQVLLIAGEGLLHGILDVHVFQAAVRVNLTRAHEVRVVA